MSVGYVLVMSDGHSEAVKLPAETVGGMGRKVKPCRKACEHHDADGYCPLPIFHPSKGVRMADVRRLAGL